MEIIDLLIAGATLLIMTAFAGAVESLVEFFISPLFDKIPGAEQYKWALMYIPIPLALLIAFTYGFDIFHELSISANKEIPTTDLGVALTGMMIARGSNYVHQFVQKFFPVKR
jgi:hypothetical protein